MKVQNSKNSQNIKSPQSIKSTHYIPNSKNNTEKCKFGEDTHYTSVDSIVDNLMSTKEASINGNLINDEGNGSFSNINTSIYGAEVDVDDL